MARRGYNCRCCDNAELDPCLTNCRPAGETRPISSLEITLSAFDYLLSFDGEILDFASPPNVTPFTFKYLFPGSIYSGTFELTPRSEDSTVFEYFFSSCGTYSEFSNLPCLPYMRYYTDGLKYSDTERGGCGPTFLLPALVTRSGDPSCDGSLAIDVRRFKSYNFGPSGIWGILYGCGRQTSLVLDARGFAFNVPPFNTPFEQFFLPTLLSGNEYSVSLPYGCNDEFGSNVDASGFPLSYLFPVVNGTDNPGAIRRTSSVTEQGDPRVFLRRITAYYD